MLQIVYSSICVDQYPLTNIEISSLMILCVTDCFSCISQKIRKFLLYCHQTLLSVLHVHNENYMPTGLIRFAANDSAMSSASIPTANIYLV